MESKKIKKVSVVGMGALGLLFGKHIADCCGKDTVEFVMGKSRYDQYKNQAFYCNGTKTDFQITLDTEAKPTDLVIVAVKYTGLQEALETMQGCIGPHTIILSVMNGITSEQIIGEKFGMNKLIYSVAQGMDAMKFGNELNYTTTGELLIGITDDSQKANLDSVVDFFREIQLNYTVEEDMLYRLWGKFMLNVGVNQTCMVYGTTYAGVLAEGEPNRTMVAAMREVIALANAEGVALSEKDLNHYLDILRTLSPEGTPSMGQDRINRKPSEVEMFAGAVRSLAKKYDICVPANDFLYKSVIEIEKGYLSEI